MKLCLTRFILMTRLAALALIALCLLQAPVRAQGTAGYTIIFPSVGLASGQTLRLTLFNPDGAPLRAQAQIHNAGGVLVASGDGSVQVPGGAFHSFDFNHGDIPPGSEEGSGRVQLSTSLRVTMSRPWKKKDGLTVSMETVSISDGTSNTIFFSEVLPPVHGGSDNDVLVGGIPRDILMGIVPGQTLRVTMLNPKPLGLDYLPSSVKSFDADGNLIAQSDESLIPSGEFRSFDFNRDALPLRGEPGTSRIQMRMEPFFDFESERLPAPLSSDRVLTDVISFEIVDNSTGETEVLSGHQCLVFFLGGTPGN